ncbi:MAG: twin-arginine translocase TatA/TatE family subunit [Dehalococcoidia bacterium]|nr:twin-arginine translocase TatA/TatE family subunit [Dehalococcoidia bacterium]
MELFGVGWMEAGLILVITLLVVGPERFPHIAREGGKYYRMARRYADEVMKDVRGAMEELESEVKTQTEDLREIRDIGRNFSTSGGDTLREIREIGTRTREAAGPAGGAPGTTEETASSPARNE